MTSPILQRLSRPPARRLDSRGGFTLVETLVALLILVGLTAVVAAGIPVAFQTYQRVVDGSNAELALSATASALRDELGLAVKSDSRVVGEGGQTYFRSSNGYWAVIDNAQEGEGKGLVKRVYKGTDIEPNILDEPQSTQLVPDAVIAGAAGGDAMEVSMESLSYDPGKGVFVVAGLKAEVNGSEVARVDTYEVRPVMRWEAG